MVSGKREDADTFRGLIRSQLGPYNTLRQEEPVPCGPGETGRALSANRKRRNKALREEGLQWSI